RDASDDVAFTTARSSAPRSSSIPSNTVKPSSDSTTAHRKTSHGSSTTHSSASSTPIAPSTFSTSVQAVTFDINGPIPTHTLNSSIYNAFLSGLGVTVLVLYVMNPPVSNAIQGAYVVAAILTGLVVGGVSIIFAEITEGLGCLLGGFCLSMWLMVLKPGGLLTSNSGKGALIGAISLAAFATSFSHYTRPYALIGFISFAGGTAIVLGIDSFSRAGLLQFWAYVWNINSNMFPLGVTTYPITRGLRVEISAIIIIFIAGIISQMKLWKVVKERRAKREEERLKREHSLQREDEEAGRRIEEHLEEERHRWEATYSEKNKKEQAEGSESLRDSGVSEMDIPMRTWTNDRMSTWKSGQDTVEMTPAISAVGDGYGKAQETTITVRQMEAEGDDNPDIAFNTDQVISVQDPETAEGSTQPKNKPWQRPLKHFAGKSTSSVPPVLPLASGISEEREKERDNCSEVATLADEEEPHYMQRFSKRFSTGADFLRKFAQKSAKRFSRDDAKETNAANEGSSSEELVARQAVGDDCASSVAATVDDLNNDTGDIESIATNDVEDGQKEIPSVALKEVHSMSSTSTVMDTPVIGVNKGKSRSSINLGLGLLEQEHISEPVLAKSPTIERPPSAFTKDQLPRQVSKVVLSYRTSEWAKHLDDAETPDVGPCDAAGPLPEPPANDEAVMEEAVPVQVRELQETPLSAPTLRPSSALSNNSKSHLARPSLPQLQSIGSSYQVPESQHSPSHSLQSANGIITRPASSASSARPGHLRRVSGSILTEKPIMESPIEESTQGSNAPGTIRMVPYTASLAGDVPTLLGVRDAALRDQTSYTPNLSAHSSTFDLNISPRSNSTPNFDNVAMNPQMWAAYFNAHQPKRESAHPPGQVRERQLASWRADVQNDLRGTVQVYDEVDTRRQAQWMDQQRRTAASKKLQERERDSVFNERMRRADMLQRHREAMKKMQEAANKKVGGA
ncbi:hypothetical protein DH86_00000884, partial [Scytalidium sp. 3C]